MTLTPRKKDFEGSQLKSLEVTKPFPCGGLELQFYFSLVKCENIFKLLSLSAAASNPENTLRGESSDQCHSHLVRFPLLWERLKFVVPSQPCMLARRLLHIATGAAWLRLLSVLLPCGQMPQRGMQLTRLGSPHCAASLQPPGPLLPGCLGISTML